jgi:hypothetical protein
VVVVPPVEVTGVWLAQPTIDYPAGAVVPDENGLIVWQTDFTVDRNTTTGFNNNLSIFLTPQGYTGPGATWWAQVNAAQAPISFNYNAGSSAWAVLSEAGPTVQLWPGYRLQEGNTYQIYIIINVFTNEVEFELWLDGERIRNGATVMPPAHRDRFEQGLARVAFFIQGTNEVVYTLTNYTHTYPGRACWR